MSGNEVGHGEIARWLVIGSVDARRTRLVSAALALHLGSDA